MPPTIGNDDDVTKNPSPSNDTNKSTDTEGVELSSYHDSSGAIDSPPEVEMLVGGKRKRGSKATRRKNKRRHKTAIKNNNCRGGARIVDTPLGNGEEQRECLKRALLNVGTGGNEDGASS